MMSCFIRRAFASTLFALICAAKGVVDPKVSKLRAVFSIQFGWTTVPGSLIHYDLGFAAVTCPNAGAIHWLQDESMDWGKCENVDLTTLICNRFRPGFGDGIELVSWVVVACEGTSEASVSTITANLSEGSLSSTNASDLLTRHIEIQRVSDIKHKSGSRRYHLHLPTKSPIRGHLCNGEGPLNMTSSSCSFSVSCLDLENSPSNECQNMALPPVSAEVTHMPNPANEAGKSFLFATSPYQMPALQSPGSVHYTVEVSYSESGCTTDNIQGHSVTLQCQRGGRIEVLNRNYVLGSCSTFDISTMVCRIPVNVTLYSGRADISCSGTSLAQMALTNTWNPGRLACSPNPNDTDMIAVRSLDTFQVCPEKTAVHVIGPYPSLIAQTCLPLSSSSVGDITMFDGETQEHSAWPIEYCSDVIGRQCQESCIEDHLPRLVSEIKPEHIDLTCLRNGASIEEDDPEAADDGAVDANEGDEEKPETEDDSSACPRLSVSVLGQVLTLLLMLASAC